MTLHEFLGEFKSDRRLVDYVKTMLQWAEIANKYDKTFIVYGGFAVDLEVGKITRTHDDLDVCVELDDLIWFKERFEVDGYKFKYNEGKKEDKHFVGYKYNFMIEDSLYVEVASIHIENSEVWDDVEGKKYIWPISPDKLTEEIVIDDKPVKFLSSEVVAQFKKSEHLRNKEIREKDTKDLEILLKLSERKV